jgi:phage portal protein BeeE
VSILRDAFGRSALPDTVDYASTGGYWSNGMVWHGDPTNVTTPQAMRLSAVFACLRLLSEAIATLPLDTFIRFGGTRQPWRPRPDYLSFQPPQGSRIDYLSQVMLSLLTDGNAYILTPATSSASRSIWSCWTRRW